MDVIARDKIKKILGDIAGLSSDSYVERNAIYVVQRLLGKLTNRARKLSLFDIESEARSLMWVAESSREDEAEAAELKSALAALNQDSAK